MKIATVLFAFLLISTEMLRHADAHGWMVDPVPRSGGGTGTANASTGAPCGKTGPTTITASWTTNSSITVGYMNANGHGATGNTVTLSFQYKTNFPNYNAPTTADFTTAIDLTSGGKGLMDTTKNTVQNHKITAPVALGEGILQFKWEATDGSRWYDCAYVEIAAAGVGACATNNGGCSPNAQCTDVNGAAVCKCKAGYYGTGITCALAPPPVQVYIYTDVKVPQDEFTVAIAAVLKISPSRILYDTNTAVTTGQRASFYITSDENGTDPVDTSAQLRALVTRGDPAFAQNFKTYQILSVQIVGKDASPRAFGLAPSSAVALKVNLGYIAVLVAFLALFAV